MTAITFPRKTTFIRQIERLAVDVQGDLYSWAGALPYTPLNLRLP
jgi:hypothetical protein